MLVVGMLASVIIVAILMLSPGESRYQQGMVVLSQLVDLKSLCSLVIKNSLLKGEKDTF